MLLEKHYDLAVSFIVMALIIVIIIQAIAIIPDAYAKGVTIGMLAQAKIDKLNVDALTCHLRNSIDPNRTNQGEMLFAPDGTFDVEAVVLLCDILDNLFWYIEE